MNSALIKPILLVVPITIFVIEYFFIQKIYPLYHDSDPAYQYLLNGLLILQGNTPYHIDHPGTPVQTLIAGVIYISWWFAKSFGLLGINLDISVGMYPEVYLQIVSYILVSLNCIASYILGIQLLKTTGRIGISLFIQATSIAFAVTFTRMSYPEPEALLILASMLLIASLAPAIFFNPSGTYTNSICRSMLAGVICGFGIAVKLTFIPMLGMLFLLRSTKSILISFLAAALAWLVFISPMIKELPRFFNWIGGIARHSGQYGSGKAEFIDPSQIIPRLKGLTQIFELWFLVAFLLFCAVIYFTVVVFRRSEPKVSRIASLWGLACTPIILCTICVGQTILVLKHPGARYMLPALIIQSIGLIWIVLTIPKPDIKFQYRRFGGGILALMGFGLMLNAANSSYQQLSAERALFSKDMNSIESYIAKFDKPVLIGTYGCRLLQCALSFGLGYAPATNPKVGDVLTDFYDFNIWAKKLVIKGRGFFELDLIAQELGKKRPVLLVTNQPPEQLKSFNLKLIYTGPAQSLYHVTGLNTH